MTLNPSERVQQIETGALRFRCDREAGCSTSCGRARSKATRALTTRPFSQALHSGRNSIPGSNPIRGAYRRCDPPVSVALPLNRRRAGWATPVRLHLHGLPSPRPQYSVHSRYLVDWALCGRTSPSPTSNCRMMATPRCSARARTRDGAGAPVVNRRGKSGSTNSMLTRARLGNFRRRQVRTPTSRWARDPAWTSTGRAG